MTGPKSSNHIVAFALPFWGHIKPLCALSAKIVRVQHVYITLFTAEEMLSKTTKEVERQFKLEQESHLRDLIRVVALPRVEIPFVWDELQAAFVEQYRKLWSGEPVPIAPGSDESFDAVPPPQLIILDFFCYESMKGIRSVSGNNVPIYAWQSGAVASVLVLFGPEEYGGLGDLDKKLDEIKTEDSEAREKEISSLLRREHGHLIEIPGIPPMYDYEHKPQIVALPMSNHVAALAVRHVYRFFEESDGSIHSTSYHYEGGALELWKQWHKEKPVYAIGPLSPPPTLEEVEREMASNPISAEVEEFLNKAFDTYGPNSVIYMSFGTVWWSKEPEKIWAVVDTFIEKGVPFLFSHASPFAVVPEDIKEKVKSSGLGLMANWLPQQMIFRHKACGWFLSHCGHNSVMESLAAGIPMICWPFDADQPGNAANITMTHNAGYELLEVRNGLGLLPLHRLNNKSPRGKGTVEAVRQEISEVIDKARGEDGDTKRSNAQKLGVLLSETWDEHGSGWRELRRMVESL